MAAIEPGLRAAASAIARPRSRTSAIASSRVIASAAASAANSPTEWPMTKSALMPRSLQGREHRERRRDERRLLHRGVDELLGVGVEAEALEIEAARLAPAPEDVHRRRNRLREVAAHPGLERALAREAERDLVHAARLSSSSASARSPR